jgi:Mce-associated membrane protein
VLALSLVAVAAVLGLGVWSYGDVREQDRIDQATRTAPAAAERASAAILSYDYQSLGADEKAAERYLTPAFKKQYVASMRLVQGNAPKLRAKVEADVKASGVVHAGADRVNVLVYVNQTTTSTANGGQPQIALNRAMFSMVRHGNAWLVDDITSY